MEISPIYRDEAPRDETKRLSRKKLAFIIAGIGALVLVAGFLGQGFAAPDDPAQPPTLSNSPQRMIGALGNMLGLNTPKPNPTATATRNTPINTEDVARQLTGINFSAGDAATATAGAGATATKGTEVTAGTTEPGQKTSNPAGTTAAASNPAAGPVVAAPTDTGVPTAPTTVAPAKTPRPAPTNTARPAPTNPPDPVPMNTPRPVPTNPPAPTPTSTAVPPTNTPTPAPTSSPKPTATPIVSLPLPPTNTPDSGNGGGHPKPTKKPKK